MEKDKVMENFRKEQFPELSCIKKFDKQINKIQKKIINNKSISETLKSVIPKQGAYFFYDTHNKRIVYVGISRNIRSRLLQHINHKSSLSASLAYLIAKDGLKEKSIKEIKECFEKAKEENNCRNKYQEEIKKFKVAFVENENYFELALFEIYAAIKLKTYWNSFRTH